MAEKVFWKIWSLVLSSIAILSTNAAANIQRPRENVTAKISQLLPFLRKSEKSDYFLERTSIFDEDMVVAGHSSHRSHASHSSHSSHYSGSGGSSSRTPSESTPDTSEPKQVVPSTTSPQPKTPSTPVPKSNAVPASPAINKYDQVRKVYLHNGASFDCDLAWVSEGKIFFQKTSKVYSLPIEAIDLPKTFGGSKGSK